MSLCVSCAEFGTPNLGGAANQPEGKAPFKFIMVPTFGSNGQRNHIAKADLPLTDTYISGKINALNPLDRWYVTPQIHNPEGERADPNFIEDSLQNRQVTSEGRREVIVQFWKGGPVLMDKLNKYFCGDFSFFVIDDCGNLRGAIGSVETDKFFPRRIAEKNMSTKLVEVIGADGKEHVVFRFDLDRREDDAKIRMIGAKQIEVDLRDLDGLVDVTVEGTITATASALVIKLVGSFGNFVDPMPITNLPKTAFVITNVTQSAPVVIDSFSESAPGIYNLGYTAGVTVADVLSLTLTNLGKNFAAVNGSTVTVA